MFNPNPVVALGDWLPLLSKGRPVRRVPDTAYESVRLEDLTRSGRLDGPWVTTSPTKNRLKVRSLDFELKSHERSTMSIRRFGTSDRLATKASGGFLRKQFRSMHARDKRINPSTVRERAASNSGPAVSTTPRTAK